MHIAAMTLKIGFSISSLQALFVVLKHDWWICCTQYMVLIFLYDVIEIINLKDHSELCNICTMCYSSRQHLEEKVRRMQYTFFSLCFYPIDMPPNSISASQRIINPYPIFLFASDINYMLLNVYMMQIPSLLLSWAFWTHKSLYSIWTNKLIF